MHIRPNDVATWLRNSVSAAGADGLLVPLGDSVGSAVTARLCQIAMEERVVAVLPADGQADAALAAEVFRIRVLRLPADLACPALGTALSGTLAASNEPPVTGDR